MLSVARCRDLLLNEARDWSDARVEALQDELYALALILLEGLPRSDVAEASPIEAALRLVPAEQQTDLEERAAILEFDARLPRDEAERAAVADYVLRLRS